VKVHNPYYDTLMALSPEGYWRLAALSGTTARDYTGRHDGWYENGVALGRESALVGANNTSAGFDGLNDYVTVGSFDLGGSDLTLTAWVKPSSSTLTGRYILGKSASKAGNTHCWSLGAMAASGRNQLAFRLRAGGVTDANLLLGGTLTSGQWTFVAAVYTGANMILYQDGNEVARSVRTGGIRTDDNAGVWIGNVPPDTSSGAWPGLIDEVAVFRSALSPAQVLALYKSRSPQITILSWGE
jgi:hypothetical protein